MKRFLEILAFITIYLDLSDGPHDGSVSRWRGSTKTRSPARPASFSSAGRELAARGVGRL
jgi:hypothetical protein